MLTVSPHITHFDALEPVLDYIKALGRYQHAFNQFYENIDHRNLNKQLSRDLIYYIVQYQYNYARSQSDQQAPLIDNQSKRLLHLQSFMNSYIDYLKITDWSGNLNITDNYRQTSVIINQNIISFLNDLYCPLDPNIDQASFEHLFKRLFDINCYFAPNENIHITVRQHQDQYMFQLDDQLNPQSTYQYYDIDPFLRLDRNYFASTQLPFDRDNTIIQSEYFNYLMTPTHYQLKNEHQMSSDLKHKLGLDLLKITIYNTNPTEFKQLFASFDNDEIQTDVDNLIDSYVTFGLPIDPDQPDQINLESSLYPISPYVTQTEIEADFRLAFNHILSLINDDQRHLLYHKLLQFDANQQTYYQLKQTLQTVKSDIPTLKLNQLKHRQFNPNVCHDGVETIKRPTVYNQNRLIQQLAMIAQF